MPVMLEYISDLIPREVLEEKYLGGFRRFRSSFGDRVFCCDRYIARVSFMGPQGVDWFIEQMSLYGLMYIEDGKCGDMAVVDWFSGPCVPCEWLADNVIADGCRSVAHIDDDSTEISKPEYYSSEEYLKEVRANNGPSTGQTLTGYLMTALGWALFLVGVSFSCFVLLWHLTAWLES